MLMFIRFLFSSSFSGDAYLLHVNAERSLVPTPLGRANEDFHLRGEILVEGPKSDLASRAVVIHALELWINSSSPSDNSRDPNELVQVDLSDLYTKKTT
jgi:hypothetical protein